MTLRRGAILCFFLSLAGLCLAGYLSFIHLALLRGELVGGPVCGGIGSFFNCHAVAASRYADLLGVPAAFWGVLGYLVLLTLSLIAWKFPELHRQALTAVAGLAGAFLVLDTGLLWIMLAKIRALCALCLLMYGIKGFLLLIAQRALGRRWSSLFKPAPSFWLGLRSPAAPAASWLLLGVSLTGLAGVLSVHATSQYFAHAPGSLQERIARRMQTAERVAVAAGDSPRLGSPNAPVQAVIFTDLLCPLCREAAQFNAVALAAHRGKISIVVKQFPLDRDCNGAIGRTIHPGACRLAEAALCAREQGKFWAFQNRLFQAGPPADEKGLEETAYDAGINLEELRACQSSGRAREAVMREIEEGRKLGVTAAPTFFINGVQVIGAVTPAQFDEIIRQEENKAAPIQGEKP